MHVWELTVVFQYAASTCSLNMSGSAGGRIGEHRQARKQSKNCVRARADCKEDLGPAALRGAGMAGAHARCLAAWVAALRSLPAWAVASCSCLALGRCTLCAGLSTGEGVACRAGMSSTWFGDCLTVLCKALNKCKWPCHLMLGNVMSTGETPVDKQLGRQCALSLAALRSSCPNTYYCLLGNRWFWSLLQVLRSHHVLPSGFSVSTLCV